ncbi:MAG: hypothetical protein ACYC4H_14905 [Desulfocucumaceae bacterium]
MDYFNYAVALTRKHAYTLDRFSSGLRDAQEAPVVDFCNTCGGEIYPGEVYQDADTGRIYCESECAPEGAELMLVGINENGEVSM